MAAGMVIEILKTVMGDLAPVERRDGALIKNVGKDPPGLLRSWLRAGFSGPYLQEDVAFLQ